MEGVFEMTLMRTIHISLFGFFVCFCIAVCNLSNENCWPFLYLNYALYLVIMMMMMIITMIIIITIIIIISNNEIASVIILKGNYKSIFKKKYIDKYS